MLPSRNVVFDNQLEEEEVEVCEIIDLGAAGAFPQRRTLLKPMSRKSVRLSKYCNRSLYSNRPSIIEFRVNGVVKDWLVPAELARFVKITLYMDEIGTLTLWGVEPKFYDICCLSGFGFLGRHYRGRPQMQTGQNAMHFLDHE